MSEPARDYVSIATDYAYQVVTGRIIACNWVRLACQRHIDDLTRLEFKYQFDTDRAAHVCKFIELLPHVKGKWAREKNNRIHLEPWQVFILCSIFGWIDSNGNRRYKVAYIEVPRKNAKSTIAAGIGLYCLAADYEQGAEVYSAATTRDQARIVWRTAKTMTDRCYGLRARFGVQTGAHAIFVDDTDSTFKPLSRDSGGNLDGLNVSCGLIDELHAHKTRDVYDVIETATGSRDQPLLLLITTAGSNRAGICYEQRAYVIEVLNDVAMRHPKLVSEVKGSAANDDEYFGIIYTVDESDMEQKYRLFEDPNLWKKANPNYGVSVSAEDIARLGRKAARKTSAQNNFLTKRLNVWVNAATAWLDMLKWESCARPDLTIEQFAGARAWIAGDLATKIDIASLAIVIETNNGYVTFGRHYLPEETLEESENSQYEGWAEQNHLIVTDGSAIDFETIEQDLIDLCDLLDVQVIGFDPWQAEMLRQRLEKAGKPTIQYRQLVANMSAPMKELEAWVLSRKMQHDGCPVLTWMISNVLAKEDAKENIYPRKEDSASKIDGAVALIMAVGLAIGYESEDKIIDVPDDYQVAVA